MSTFRLETAKAACNLMPDAAMKEVALGAVDRFQKSVDEMFSKDFAKHPASTTASSSAVSVPDVEKLLQIMQRYARRPADQVVRYEVSSSVWEALKQKTDLDCARNLDVFMGVGICGIAVVEKPGFFPGSWKEIFADGREVWHLGPYQMSMPARPVIPARPVAVTNA